MNITVKERVRRILEAHPEGLTHSQLLSKCANGKFGVTKNELSSILKDRMFRKVGTSYYRRSTSEAGGRKIAVWGLAPVANMGV